MTKKFDKEFRFSVDIVKSEGDVDGDFYVEGYASTSDLDRQGDIICSEALKSAAQNLEEVNNTVFFGHKYDLNSSVGKIVKVTVDDVGLKTKIFVSSWAKELRTKLKEGIINKYSIGGKVVKNRAIPKNEAMAQGIIERDVPFDQINIIENIELYEVSFVGVPANPNAVVTSTLAKALFNVRKSQESKDEGGVDMEDKEKQDQPKAAAEAQITEDETASTVVPEDTTAKEEPKAEEPKVEEPAKEEDTPVVAETEKPEAVADGKDLSDEEIKELLDEPKAEGTKEAVVSLTKDDINKSLEPLMALIKELASLIQDKVKTIEISAEKKSVVKDEAPKVKKEVKEIKVVDAEEEFLGFIKGEKESI